MLNQQPGINDYGRRDISTNNQTLKFISCGLWNKYQDKNDFFSWDDLRIFCRYQDQFVGEAKNQIWLVHYQNIQ